MARALGPTWDASVAAVSPKAPRTEARNGAAGRGSNFAMTYLLGLLAGAFVGSAVSVCAMAMAAMSAVEEAYAPDRADNLSGPSQQPVDEARVQANDCA